MNRTGIIDRGAGSPQQKRKNEKANEKQRNVTGGAGAPPTTFSMFRFVDDFFNRCFIDFWTPRWRANIVKYNGKSIFSCFQTVFNFHDFWPPKIDSRPPKTSLFRLCVSTRYLCLWMHLVFRKCKSVRQARHFCEVRLCHNSSLEL